MRTDEDYTAAHAAQARTLATIRQAAATREHVPDTQEVPAPQPVPDLPVAEPVAEPEPEPLQGQPGGDDLLTTEALRGVRALLRLMGEDPGRPGLVNTPARMVKAYLELASRPGNPKHDLAVVFSDVQHPGTPVTVGPVRFVSLCEHHLLPFTGTAWVSYVPRAGRVVGLSKLPRTIAHYAARPQVQERLTTQITDALVEYVDPLGVGVLVQGTHSCMTLRGARAGGRMRTYDLRGIMREDATLRDEFLAAAK